jgi:predicted amidohydrolase YtcJ
MLQAQIFMTNSKGFEMIPKMIGTYADLAVPDEDGLGNMRYYNSTMYQNYYFHHVDRTDDLAEAFRKGLELAAAEGITTHGSSLEGLRSWDAFKYLAMQGPMPIRSGFSLRTGFFDNMNTPDFVRRSGDFSNMGTPYVWVLGLTYGSNDANFPNICSTMEAPAQIKEMGVCKAEYDKNGPSYLEGMYWAVRNRHRIMMGHTAGDKALDLVLDKIEQAIEDDPGITLEYVRSRHYTTDHCTFYPRPAQIPRLAKLGFILSCGSGLDGRARILAQYFSMHYASWIAPVRSLLDAGVKVSFEGEGNPGGSHLAGGIQLMTRMTSDGTPVAPEMAIKRNEFAKMVTSWAAEFMGKPDEIGTLEVGKWADFVILNKDYFTVPMEEINTTRPLMTVVGGNISFLRQEFAAELGREPVGPQVDYNAPQENGGGGD